jgi:DNA polymerase alpha subunit B
MNLFHAHFVGPLKAFLTTSPGSTVLMVPHVRDIISDHSAFPQPELSSDFFGLDSVSNISSVQKKWQAK